MRSREKKLVVTVKTQNTHAIRHHKERSNIHHDCLRQHIDRVGQNKENSEDNVAITHDLD